MHFLPCPLLVHVSILVGMEVEKQPYVYRQARVEYSRCYFTEIFLTQRTITISSHSVKKFFRKFMFTTFEKIYVFYNHC
jgi:hypothetical protein